MLLNIVLFFKKRLRLDHLLVVFLITSLFVTKLSAQINVRDSILQQIKYLKQQENFKETDTTYINSIIELGFEQRFYNLDSLFLLTSQGLDLSKKAAFKKGMASSLNGLATFYSDKGKYSLAIKNYEAASKLAEEINDTGLMIRAINNLGTEYRYKNNYATALKIYLEALEFATKFDDKVMLSIINENIANLYLDQKDYEQGMLFYNKVKKINEEIGNSVYMAETMSNMASSYADMGKLDYAMFNVNSSITTFEEKKIFDWLAFAYEIKGKIYLKQNKFEWAMYWYRQSELLHQELQDERGKISLLNGMAEASLGLKKDSISEVFAYEALHLSEKIDFKSAIKDCAKILYNINKNKADYKNALKYHELYEALTDTLSRKENMTGLTMLKTKIEYDQQKEQLIFENEKALARQKTYMYWAVLILLIFAGITLLIRRNERIQKNLNKELLSKKADLEKKEQHLKDANQTKDKLFSIIGHDLRGPIGAFQGLLRLFREGEMSKDEFLGFVPKLKLDIDHIAFTLNNLLSWGQTQMNGSVTKPRVTSLENIVDENIALLSEISASKSIKLINKIEANTLTWADSDQLDIVVRNLISNALKFTPEKGMVTIEAIEKSNYWEICVRDNGVGMSEETLGKIFSNTSTHTTYGTNDEKGTGLGLALCKEMVEKNNGVIWAESAPDKGSSFYFTVPKAKKEYKNIA